MCWGIRNAATDIVADPLVASFAGEATRSGLQTLGIRRHGGELVATAMRFGMVPPGPMGRRDMFWNARSEKIDKVTIWTRLNRQRCVVPISGYCENRPAETWMTGPDSYLIALYDTDRHDGGLVVLTETDGTAAGRRPVVTDRAGALAWLDAPHWDLQKTIAGLARVVYEEVDLFECKRLSVDVRTMRRAA